MQDKTYISIEEYCNYYSIETSFVRSLDEHGLIELQQTNQSYSIEYAQLPQLEKFIHLHYGLDINIEGIEAISHLLQRIDNMHTELLRLKNQLQTS